MEKGKNNEKAKRVGKAVLNTSNVSKKLDKSKKVQSGRARRQTYRANSKFSKVGSKSKELHPVCSPISKSYLKKSKHSKKMRSKRSNINSKFNRTHTKSKDRLGKESTKQFYHKATYNPTGKK